MRNLLLGAMTLALFATAAAGTAAAEETCVATDVGGACVTTFVGPEGEFTCAFAGLAAQTELLGVSVGPGGACVENL